MKDVHFFQDIVETKTKMCEEVTDHSLFGGLWKFLFQYLPTLFLNVTLMEQRHFCGLVAIHGIALNMLNTVTYVRNLSISVQF